MSLNIPYHCLVPKKDSSAQDQDFKRKGDSPKGKPLFRQSNGNMWQLWTLLLIKKSDEGMLKYSKKNNEIFRMSNEHAQDIKAVVAFLKSEANIPVWLVGTSLGTFSVPNGAIRIKEGIGGLVLTSSVTRRKKYPKGILNMDLDKIIVPTLIVAHKDDKCPGCPPSDAPQTIESHF